MGAMTSIIIVSYNTLEFTKGCIESIRQYTAGGTYELIVIDNDSQDGSVEWLLSQKDITLVVNHENLGFPKGCNQGMKLAAGSELLLLNSDTLVTVNWLENLKAALYSRPDVGAVGPVTNSCANGQSIKVDYSSFDGLQDFAAQYNRISSEKWHTWLTLVGYCFLLRREVYEKVGGMDEIFSPGNYEDDDYSIRVRLAGYNLLLCEDTFIHHYGMGSFKNNQDSVTQKEKMTRYMALSERNDDIFREKYGLVELQRFTTKTTHKICLTLLPYIAREKKVLVLDVGLGADLYSLKRYAPELNVTGVSSLQLVKDMNHGDLDIVYAPHASREPSLAWIEGLKREYGTIIWATKIEVSQGAHVMEEIAGRLLLKGGKMFWSDGDEIRITALRDAS